MTNQIIICDPDVVALVETAAKRLTDGDETEVIAISIRRLLEQEIRSGSLFGVHHGSVRGGEGVDLIQPVFVDDLDAETGKEIEL